MARISIIIPHYNDLDNLDACLARLTSQTAPRGDYEIIVADNNSRCGVEAVRAVAGDRATVILATEQGAGAARNAAVAQSKGEILAFIDSDCMAAPDWVEKGVAALARADVIGGAVDVLIQGTMPNAVEAFERVFAFRMRHYVEEQKFAGSGNLFTRRSTFDRVGGYRSVVAEDMDWSFRAQALGFTLAYADDVRVGHPARANWAELQRKWRRTTKEMYMLAAERPRGRLKWFARNFAVLASPLPHVAKVWTSPQIRGLGPRLGATGVLFRLRAYRFVEGMRLLAGGR